MTLEIVMALAKIGCGLCAISAWLEGSHSLIPQEITLECSEWGW